MTHKFHEDDQVRVVGEQALITYPFLKGQTGRITRLFTRCPQEYESAVVEFDLPHGVDHDDFQRRNKYLLLLDQLERVWPTEFQPKAPYHVRIVLDLVGSEPIDDHMAEIIAGELNSTFLFSEVKSFRQVPTDEIDFIADLIEKEEYDQASDLIDRLESRLGGSTPETTMLSTRISRIQILGE